MTAILREPQATPAPVLYLAHRVPVPPDKGDRIRTFNVLKHLAGRGPVDLACLADEPVAPASLEVLRGLCRRVEVIPHSGKRRYARALSWLAAGRSLSEGAFWSPRFASVVQEWSRSTNYAAVLTSASSMGPYLDLQGLRDTPAVVDMMDVDSQKWRDYSRNAAGPKRWLYELEARRVERLERRLATRTRALLVVSETEAELFRRFCPEGPVRVVPNGVDLDYFHPVETPGERRLDCSSSTPPEFLSSTKPSPRAPVAPALALYYVYTTVRVTEPADPYGLDGDNKRLRMLTEWAEGAPRNCASVENEYWVLATHTG